jgi:ADP-ribosylglycohydrolase
MWGAIAGDMIGSVYERHRIKTEDFPLWSPYCRFTDDTVLSVAVARSILSDGDYAAAIKVFGRRYPHAGYGGAFKAWLASPSSEPYNSWGNGSAMRVYPVGFAFEGVEKVLEEAEKSAAVTHNHPEGVKGAQAVALAVYLACKGSRKEEIRTQIGERFGYDLSQTLGKIRPNYRFDVSCQGSVPQAITAFLESESVEDAIRKAISLGGDSDTLACIAGGIAEAFYGGVPEEMRQRVKQLLTPDLLQVVEDFYSRYMND